jgi:hypothetical protein
MKCAVKGFCLTIVKSCILELYFMYLVIGWNINIVILQFLLLIVVLLFCQKIEEKSCAVILCNFCHLVCATWEENELVFNPLTVFISQNEAYLDLNLVENEIKCGFCQKCGG